MVTLDPWGQLIFKRLLSSLFVLDQIEFWRLREQSICNQTHCHLFFFSDWKNIELPWVTQSSFICDFMFAPPGGTPLFGLNGYYMCRWLWYGLWIGVSSLKQGIQRHNLVSWTVRLFGPEVKYGGWRSMVQQFTLYSHPPPPPLKKI